LKGKLTFLEKTEPKKTAENRTDFSKEKAPKMKIKKDEREPE